MAGSGGNAVGRLRRPPTEYDLTLRQADQARTDFAVIGDDLEFIMSRLAQVPRRKDVGWVALASFLGGAVFATCVNLIVWR